MYTQKMYEVQKFATLTNHGYLGYVILTNKKFWDGLPPDIRSALEKALAETTPVALEMAREENESSLADMRKLAKTAFHEPTADERKAWIAALAPVESEMAGRIGIDLISRIKSAVSGQ
jgi:C4-dicarboxylate-binding protein DctP